MAKRKATPNPLDDLLGGATTPPEPGEKGGQNARANVPDVAPRAPQSVQEKADDADGPAFQRTSTGYVRGSGETLRRVSFFLTESQRRELRSRVAQAGFDDLTGYLVEELGLNRMA